MPRRKRSRRQKKHNHRNHFGSRNEFETFQEDPVRTYTSLESPSNIAARITEEFGFKKIPSRTPSPKTTSRSSSAFSPVRKRRSPSREMGYSALPLMFDLSNNSNSFISNLRTCQSSTILERSGMVRPKHRSSSSMAKLHSPGVERTPLKSETSTQTCNLITETPRINQEDLLELDYEISLIGNSPVSGYGTPLKRMRMSSNLTPIFDLKDTAVRIQDLNNFQSETNTALNCSRILSSDSLKRLQNFNEIILNTSQSVDYDNCESPEEPEKWPEPPDTVNYDVSGEISFFTPQLYNGKSASTPIEKKILEIIPNKIEILEDKIPPIEDEEKVPPVQCNVEDSTQTVKFCSVGVQTSPMEEVKFTSVFKIKSYKEKTFSVTKRRSYKSLSPTFTYHKASPKRELRISPIRRVSLEKTESGDAIAAIETCAKIMAKIKKYHGKYSSNLPAKIMEICTWLGLTIKKGVTSLYKLYTRQKVLNESITEVNTTVSNFYYSQITALKSTVAELNSEMNYMKQVDKEKSEQLSSLNRKLIQFEEKMNEIAIRLETKPMTSTALSLPPPPPPPPPPLPTFVATNPLIINRTKAPTRKKENARPIISLDDILKVKLRKATERPSPMPRRATDPLVSQSALKQIKLRPMNSRPQTPSSMSGTSSLSNSPCSSLTRMLTGIDTNVRRVKRLQRPNPYSFDDVSRKNRRERANSGCD